MHTWIKLHRALRDSDVYQDPMAKNVFFHLLLICDAKGKGRVSRFKTSLELRMKPSTFVGALKRCHQKYQLCDIKTNSYYTSFSLKNWSVYQSLADNQTDTKPTTKPTPNRHQTDTIKEEIKNKNNLDKSKLEQAPKAEIKTKKPEKKDERNQVINHVLEEFRRIYGFYPTDRKPRFVAHNLVTRIKTVTADRFGGELTEDRIIKGVTRFFDWLSRQDGLEGIQKLETAKLKLNIFMETLPRKVKNAPVSE